MNSKADATVFEHVNALIAINNERFRTYARAMQKSRDRAFRSLCAQIKERTVYFNMQLIRCLVQHDQVPVTGESGLGKAYYFGLIRRNGVLQGAMGVTRGACQWWDTIALKEYRKVVSDLRNIPREIKKILQAQRSMMESDQRYSGIALL